MTREMRLRLLILARYPSLRQFVLAAGVPYSTLLTLLTLLTRGVGGASFDVVVQICNQLDLDPPQV